ncbi:transcriptional regulator, MarR family [Burkholderia sp. lig30]|jgi:DNA-binding MarR family transcriptional regulator|uniref:MarR family winged helix-turn-helix transcriptional regulator n=1 Tax=Burkholderia sp. lig30 TaxID=1192124 RepID=UPI000461A87A|nr:MarR family winged helix-turn-helix transcriptional regulator [Burkholderia sp. lig30]KDB08175.1 transcriptional regulator, MarR family [Burkholderia sp. lig30]
MAHYSKDDFHFADNIGFAIIKARNLIAAEMDSAVKGFNVRAQHVGIFMALLRDADMTAAMLSRHLGIDAGLMARKLETLETLGMLTRSRSSDDRRVVNLKLTAAGREAALRIAEIAPDVLNTRLKRFTKAEFDELRRLIHKFLND